MDKKYNDEIVTINVRQIFKDLWHNALIIILVALLAGSAAFAFTSLFVTPEYEAVASLYVNNSSFSFGSTSFSISSSELSASNSLVKTYIYLLNSRTTLEAVIADTGVDYDYKEMKKKIVKAEGVPETAAFEVTVTSSSPQEAELIANSIAKLLPERISEIVDGTSVRIVDYAIIPAQRSSPSYTKIVAISAVLSALIAAAVVIIISISRESNNGFLTDADDILRTYPNLHVLASVPDMSVAEKKGYYYSSYYGKDKKEKK